MARTWIKDKVLDYLESVGLKGTAVGGKKHEKVVFVVNGREMHKSCARSQSTDFAEKRAVADVRRMLREVGYL